MFPEMHASIRGVMPCSSWAFFWSMDVVERRCWMVVMSLFRTASWSGSSVVDVDEAVMADFIHS